MEQGLPSASTGRASRRITGDLRLPPLPLPAQPPSSELLDADLGQQDAQEDDSPCMEIPGDGFHIWGGGTFFAPVALSIRSWQEFHEDLPALVPIEEADLPRLDLRPETHEVESTANTTSNWGWCQEN